MRTPERFNHVTQSRYGTLIYDSQDARIGRSVELYGEYAERSIVVLDQVLGPRQIAIDVGANIGVHTLFMAKKIGPEGCVLAFEPHRLTFQTLCGNMAINSITNVHCWNADVGKANGETVVPARSAVIDEDFPGSRPGQLGGDRVPVVGLDGLNLPQCDFLRIAAPGQACEVLAGATTLIKRHMPTLYIESGAALDADGKLLQLLDGLGYALHQHDAELYNPLNFAGNIDNVFGAATVRNLLCIDRSVEQQMSGFTPVAGPKAA